MKTDLSGHVAAATATPGCERISTRSRESAERQIGQEVDAARCRLERLPGECTSYYDHCYAAADTEIADGELSTAEGKALLDDLADYGAPVVLFSGGEPLVRQDLEELVAYANEVGIRPVLSTNGTLITEERARALSDAGLTYAGVSVDGLPERNDRLPRG